VTADPPRGSFKTQFVCVNVPAATTKLSGPRRSIRVRLSAPSCPLIEVRRPASSFHIAGRDAPLRERVGPEPMPISDWNSDPLREIRSERMRAAREVVGQRPISWGEVAPPNRLRLARMLPPVGAPLRSGAAFRTPWRVCESMGLISRASSPLGGALTFPTIACALTGIFLVPVRPKVERFNKALDRLRAGMGDCRPNLPRRQPGHAQTIVKETAGK
jgi:hypothetical protein